MSHGIVAAVQSCFLVNIAVATAFRVSRRYEVNALANIVRSGICRGCLWRLKTIPFAV